jgi:hypothetical protein
MADKVWIPIDVYFLSNGFPLTHERSEVVQERLARMGYRLKDLEKFMEVHERIMGKFYKGKDKVHTIRVWSKNKKKKSKVG